MKTSYKLPGQFLPRFKLDDHLTDMRELADWIEAARIQTANTRIVRYKKYLEESDLKTDAAGIRIFHDPAEHPFKSPLDRYLYVLREVHELIWIWAVLGWTSRKVLSLSCVRSSKEVILPLWTETLHREMPSLNSELRVTFAEKAMKLIFQPKPMLWRRP